MSTPIEQFEAGALTALASIITANQPAIVAAINSKEIDLEKTLVELLSKVPKVSGIAGVVANPLEDALFKAIEAYVPTLLEKYSGAYFVTAVINFLNAEAKKIAA